MSDFLKVLIAICGAIGLFWTIAGGYQYLLYIVGFFHAPKFRAAKTFHKFGLCIAARNEEKVISNLLESIANQDYDKEKMTIFVVADNCTDNTAQIARDFEKQMGG